MTLPTDNPAHSPAQAGNCFYIQCPECPERSFADYLSLIDHLNTVHQSPYTENQQASDPGPDDSFTMNPMSGYVFTGEKGPNTMESFDDDKYADIRATSPFYPFPDRDEFELAKFLKMALTSSQTDEFLKLPWVLLVISSVTKTLLTSCLLRYKNTHRHSAPATHCTRGSKSFPLAHSGSRR